MQIACVLKLGPEYKPHHLYAMANSVLDHNPGAIIRCLTDDDIDHPGIEKIPLVHNWPGWWSKLELFRPGLLEEKTLYLDIDTVVIKSLSDVSISGFTMLADVYRKGDYGSGVMGWIDPPTHVYSRFAKCPEKYMRLYRSSRRWGDQGFIRDHLGFKPATFGEEFRSYKVHCKSRVPRCAKVVYFHGKPRPWDVTLRISS